MIIENFDRFSREEVDTAREAFRQIRLKDIRIGLIASGRIYDRASLSDEMSLFEMIMEMKRAFRENEVKAERVRGAIQNRRDKRLKVATCPAWTWLDGQTYREIEDRVALVERMF